MGAEETYKNLRRHEISFDEQLCIDSQKYTFYLLNHFAETRVGVYLKTLELYGIIGFFSADEAFTTYYKSNRTFEQDETVLGYLDKDYLRSGKELTSIRRH